MIGLVLLVAALAAQAPVTFPGPQTSVRSPTSPARVFYVDMGADEAGQNLSLRYDSGRGRPVLLKRFDRSVDVAWSPSGARFFVNDHIGSNLADCLIVRPDGATVRGVSLLRVIARSPGRPRETPEDSHYSVDCGGWLTDTVVEGVVGGHTDGAGGHDFEYAFRYDAARGRIGWR
jgi:hypothetical protein